MNNKKYNWILYLISATILATIAVQFYWNYKNYQQNKQRVINEIQQSLDNAVDSYYESLSKNSFLTIVESNSLKREDRLFTKIFPFDTVRKGIKTNEGIDIDFRIHSIETDSIEEFYALKSKIIDSALAITNKEVSVKTGAPLPKFNKFTQLSSDKKSGITIDGEHNSISSVQVFKGKKAADSLKLIKGLQTIFVALQSDTLDYNKLDSILKTEFASKKITVDFGFNHLKKDTLFYSYNLDLNRPLDFKTDAISTYFNNNQRLELHYSNPTIKTLKLSATGILLSLLLSLAIISSLFHLLKIINQQKQLAEIKNDLISNITHEFKTPIATVSTALEALENFNKTNDKEKTKKYLNISSVHLNKLHSMVEKLLETATLDSEKLLLNKEEIDIINLVEKLVHKHQLIAPEKNMVFSANIGELYAQIDAFHLENAISNLIDNAVKYGGDTIQIAITSVLQHIEITVADNGRGIDKNQQEKIFDKFYRIPKGNVHDVRGFGIGLYYTKKIVEKHGGSIELSSKSNNTVFKITL